MREGGIIAPFQSLDLRSLAMFAEARRQVYAPRPTRAASRSALGRVTQASLGAGRRGEEAGSGVSGR